MDGGPTLTDIGETPEEWADRLEELGWTDGLPVVPPTPERVEAFVARTGRDRDVILGDVPPLWAEASIERVAVNGVMAGMHPELAPALIAVMEAVLDPAFNLYGIQATTNPVAPFILVSGPGRDSMGIAYKSGCLGPGFRSNATLGRALRLSLLNLGGATPGTLDRATHGSPLKYAFVAGEHAERCPWETFHEVRGIPEDRDAVTVFGVTSLVNAADQTSTHAEDLLTTIAGTISSVGAVTTLVGGPIVLLFSPEHAEILSRDGHTRTSVAQQLYERATMSEDLFAPPILKELREKRGRWVDAISGERIHALDSASSLHMAVVGGDGPHTLVARTFGATEPVTRQIDWGS